MRNFLLKIATVEITSNDLLAVKYYGCKMFSLFASNSYLDKDLVKPDMLLKVYLFAVTVINMTLYRNSFWPPQLTGIEQVYVLERIFFIDVNCFCRVIRFYYTESKSPRNNPFLAPRSSLFINMFYASSIKIGS